MAEGSTFFTSYNAGGSGASGGEANLGGYLAIAGMITSAIGTYYSLDSQKNALKSQALSMDFQETISKVNQRNAEVEAQSILESGQKESANLTREYGQARSAQRASQAARGIQAGVGSAAEELASTDLAKEIDRLSIRSNSVRAAEGSRMRGVGFGNEATMARVSAGNLRNTARSVNPMLGATSSILSGAGQVASQWADYSYRRNRTY